MVKEFTHGQMVDNMKENGIMENSMAKVNLGLKQDSHLKEFGLTEKEIN